MSIDEVMLVAEDYSMAVHDGRDADCGRLHKALRAAIEQQAAVNWHVRVSLDPAVSSDAQSLIDQGAAGAWRLASEPPEDGRRVLIWVATESGEETFRPAYCPVGGWTSVFDGETLVAWRDVTPPTEVA